MLSIPVKHLSKSGNYQSVRNMGIPKTTKSITGDGNCLFRALSFAVSQRQEYFSNMREAIVQHSLLNAGKLSSFIDSLSVEDHIVSNKMAENGSWGTAIEIIAAADLMQTDIFIYTEGRWIRYSAQQIDKDTFIHEKAIYLKHCNCHYEVVTGVTQDCEYDVENTLKRGRTEMDGSSSLKESKECNEYSGTSSKKSKKENERDKYHTFPEFKENKLKYGIKRYENDPVYKMNKMNASIKKYANNEICRENVKDASTTKYATDSIHRQNVKDASTTKYATDAAHRKTVKDASTIKYATNAAHRQNRKDASKTKYATDAIHRQNVKDISIQKYQTDESHRIKIRNQTMQRRDLEKTKMHQIENVIQKFKIESKNGPEYVCGCCLRLFFRKQVVECDFSVYEKNGIGNLSKQCISNRYVHQCTNVCKGGCDYANSSRNSLWVCFTCHRKLLSGKMPAESHANNLELENIPPELELNSLEQHLVALHIPFMKILGLPKGGQKGVHGPVVCVPSNLHKLTSALPRSEDESRLIAVKLKRKIEYKGYEEYLYISTKKLEVALNYFKQNNKWFSDIEIAQNWLNPIPEEQLEKQYIDTENVKDSEPMDIHVDSEFEQHEIDDETSTPNDINKDEVLQNKGEESDDVESYLDDRLQGVQLDTCLQPADIGQEILDQCFDEVFNISPAEGNKPVSLLQEEGIEAKCFPTHFPSGKNTFNEDRDEKLSLLRYFNMRLMSVDNRFAKDASYIFFAQYLSELDKVLSNVQIALRKDFSLTADGNRVTSNMLMNKDCLKKLFKQDEAIKYLKPIRGTPPYWQAAQKDMLAMIRQLGKPTFFCSFSSADFRWTEMLEIVSKQQGDTRNIEDLEWNEKCKMLYSNPVTLARMFDHRFHTFLKDVIMSDANPIGKVIDYFYRVEFQQRGSPHVHCLFWIDGAPQFGIDNKSDVVDFINKYITCEIPDKEEDPELHEMVTSLHQHSKNHSKSCKKKGTVCRFNFPRPPSSQTFIAETSETPEELQKAHAKERLGELWKCILDEENQMISVDEVFEKVGMAQIEFEEVCSTVGNRNTVILKRDVNEIYINQYNEHLLRAWNANMDIQYVLDEYSCVVYIISYISKAERELGLLLQQTKVEAAEGNMNAQQTMKKVGTAYLHHREISAQEAVYRVTGMNLKECSRNVVFIPLGPNPCKMSIPLKELKKAKNSSEQVNHDENTDDETMWMTSIEDRYKGRPKLEFFEEMCLAQFCSEYSVLAKSQVPKKLNEQTTFKLGKNLGYIRKRTRTQPAIIRYPRFSVETSPEKYHQSMLQLYLPYRVEQQLKPSQFETFEEFFNTGFVKLKSSETPTAVKSIVDRNKARYVKVDQALDNAERDLEERGYREDAWAQLCPEAESDRLECIMEGTSATVIEEDVVNESIPDLNQNDLVPGTNLVTTALFNKSEVIPLLRTMNGKQREIFYQIREWCLKKANGEDVQPFHVFITGGGGTGKSHLIKCLYYEMTRILSKILNNPDEASVLLTAPTGTAAFNISGMTIHSALSIYKNLSMDHALLSEDKINSLRSKFESLQVIIIDEISMVNKRMLFFIHERLRQIKKMPEDKLFGGVSVIAVGDFFQLPPVKTKKCDKLYVDDKANPMNQLWNELFEVVVLEEIMRQRSNGTFAEMLNRLRVRIRGSDIDENDLSMLKTRIQQGPDHALHIFATNAEVQGHNNDMVMKLESEVRLVEAEDYQKVKTSGQLLKMSLNFPDKDLQLPASLLLAKGARVMLTKNIDVQDGLVNGVIGTIKEIVQSSSNTLPQVIYIDFDNAKVGKNAKLQQNITGKRCIGIEPCTEDVPKRNGSRKQFPLQLAWACTIHKVQGLTVQECVVDLNKCFSCGQAYVALSRVTTLDGLYLKDVDEKVLKSKIFCDPDVANGLCNMKTFLREKEPSSEAKNVTFLYHNIEGLLNHIEDLKSNPIIRNVDFICLTETWLQEEMDCSLEGFLFKHISRSEAYNTGLESYALLKQMQHGGVGVFFKTNSCMENVHLTYSNLECLVFKVLPLNLLVVTIYRTQKYTLSQFMVNFSCLVESLSSIGQKVLIFGDFNEDIFKGEKVVQSFMESKGYRQYVTDPTTERGTLIDHVYMKGICEFNISVLPTYYSYHEAILVQLKC